jgi:predicted membrane protein
LEVSAVMGSVKIRVPEQWRVRIQGASIMGNYEDKTIPPTSEVNAATLVITGFSFMSAIEVED